MKISRLGSLISVVSVLIASSFTCPRSLAQTTSATVGGQVTDPQGHVVPGAAVVFTNINTGVPYSTTTNGQGIYTVPTLQPGVYRANVSKEGFKGIVKPDIELHVQDQVSLNFALQVGSVSEIVTVSAGAPLVNTEDASVSTVVDRNFAENLPMNGRSFQTLIELTPGVVITPTNLQDNGQFSVNGQRAASNYWMVDGVSANIGLGVNLFGSTGNGLSGSAASFSVLGGTNSLVSVDALQEFRIQTSTYAPEFGRSPGAQISILTRSGTNKFHGTLFDYLRNDDLDANDWFADRDHLVKPQERQNDFGGTFSGPILQDRTFFFLSYEGFRLRLPQVQQVGVPDLGARQSTIPAMQPYLNAFPLPTAGAPDDTNSGIAQFRASFSDRATLDAGSVRIDHRVGDKVSLFGRYDYSPSDVVQRGASGTSLNTVNPVEIVTQTGTVGATWMISPRVSNDLRFNYSRTTSDGSFYIDGFGGGVPFASPPFPNSFTPRNALFWFEILGVRQYNIGNEGRDQQRQLNLVDSLSWQRGSHSSKFGFDFRRLSPQLKPYEYRQAPFFFNIPSAENGTPLETVIDGDRIATLLFRNLGAFAQDTWRAMPRLTITYGLRWDIDCVPQFLNGLQFPAATGFNLNDLSSLALAPPGTAAYATKFDDVAPRVGAAYEIVRSQTWQTVLRGGFGIFYDLASSEAGNNVFPGVFPLGSEVLQFAPFPLDSASASPAPITAPTSSNPGSISLFDPNLKQPHTLQWNTAIEQSLGQSQSITLSYVGAAGRRLLQSAQIYSATPAFSFAQLVLNGGTSDYHALQAQFQRRLSHGLQSLVSYTWSHSIDTGSAGSGFVTSNVLIPSGIAVSNRGPSDFDIRHTLSAGVTYDIPALKLDTLTNALLGNWSFENIVQVRSAPPVDVTDLAFFGFQGGIYGDTRPDLVPGQPLYIYGAQCASRFQATGDLAPGESCPGGRGLNPAAFTNPPTSPTGCDPLVNFPCNPARQGNVGRNALRGFAAAQWDVAVHREFKFTEQLRLQFRGELFNVLNHPNFAPPSGQFGEGPGSGFGLSSAMLGRSFGGFGSAGSGGLSSLYQLGGPRSIQLALRVTF